VVVLNPDSIFDACINGSIDELHFYTLEGKELPDWISISENDTAYVLTADPMNWRTGCLSIIVEALNQVGSAVDTFQLCVEGQNPHCKPYLANPVPNLSYYAEFDTFRLELSLLDDRNFGSCRHENFDCMSIHLDDGRILPDWIKVSESDTAFHLYGTPLLQDTGCITIVVQASDAVGVISDTFELCILEPCPPVVVHPVPDTTLSVNVAGMQYLELDLTQGEIFESCDTLPFDTFKIEAVQDGLFPTWMNVVDMDSMVIIECNPTMADTSCVNLILTVFNRFGSASSTFEVCAKDIPTGIGAPEVSDFDVKLYPNPTRGDVTIEIDAPHPGDIEIMVRSINGQEVLRRSYKMTDRVSFDMSPYVSGIYVVIIDTGEHTVVKKLVLDRNN